MNTTPKICEVRMLYNRPEVWMFCGFFLVSDILASAYDVVSPSYRIRSYTVPLTVQIRFPGVFYGWSSLKKANKKTSILVADLMKKPKLINYTK